LMEEITKRRAAAVILQRRARGMNHRKKVHHKRQQNQKIVEAAGTIQRVARGCMARTKTTEMKDQREKEWYKHKEWSEQDTEAATKIQAASRGYVMRREVPLVAPFQFAVGGHIFRHPGRKRTDDVKLTKTELKARADKASAHVRRVTSTQTTAGALAQCDQVQHADDDMGLMFEMFDLNRDGFLSATDLEGVFHALGVSASLPEYSAPGKGIVDMIAEADTNGDGSLSKEEFIEYMRLVAKHVKTEKELAKKKAMAMATKKRVTAASRRSLMVMRLKGEINETDAEKAGLLLKMKKRSRW